MSSKAAEAKRTELRNAGYVVVRGDNRLKIAARAAGAFAKHGRLWLDKPRLDELKRIEAERPKCEHHWEAWDCGCSFGCEVCWATPSAARVNAWDESRPSASWWSGR